jgi:hypothetical protein
MKKIVLLFLIFLGPLSISGQNCSKIVQEVLTIEESTVVIDNAVCVINDAEKVEAPCKTLTATLFPNPCLDNFEIKGLGKENTEGSIFGVDGRFYFSVNVQKEIDVSSLAQGIYIVKIKNSSIFFKFVKQ